MKRIFSLFCAAALTLSLTACGSVSSGNAPEYDEENAISLVFSDTAITGEGEGIEIDGTALTISEEGTYVLSGTCGDGSVKVKKGTKGVTLVLDALDLASRDTAPIVCAKSSDVTILALSGTESTLSDSAENNDDNYPENENAENAVIKCKDGSQVTLCGGGTLNIVSHGKNGIKSGATTEEEGEASLTVRDLTLNITADVNDAINAEQLLNLESGTLIISAGDDAIHCDYVMNIGAEGTSGPNVLVGSCYEGIEAAELNICSGDITVHAEDDCINAANGDLESYDFFVTISGGTLTLDSSGNDGIDSNGDLSITGGTVVVWTKDSGAEQPLDADGDITITGGTVLAVGGSAGMGMNLTAEQSYVRFGSDRMMGGMGFGGGNFRDFAENGELPELPEGMDADSERPTPPDGGELPENMGERPELPDGANGEQTEPPAEMKRPENMGELPEGMELPEDFTMPGESDDENAISLAAGEAFTICDAGGKAVYSGTAVYDARFVFFSSSALTDGETYTLMSGETSLGETVATQEALTDSFHSFGANMPEGFSPDDRRGNTATDETGSADTDENG